MRGDPKETSAESLARQRAHRARRGVKAPRLYPRLPSRPATSGPPKHPMPASYTDADGVVRADKRVPFDPAAHPWFAQGHARLDSNGHLVQPWFRPREEECTYREFIVDGRYMTVIDSLTPPDELERDGAAAP